MTDTNESSGESHIMEKIRERTSPEPDGRQKNTSNVWTGRSRMRSDGSKDESPLDRGGVDTALDSLISSREVYEWHGLLAPADEDHLRAIIENERMSDTPRRLLIGNVNAWLQEAGQ
jgi:hypothetical protein